MAAENGNGNGWARSLALVLFTIIFTSVVERLWVGDVITKQEMNQALTERIGNLSDSLRELKASVGALLDEVKHIEIEQAKASVGKHDR